MNAYESFYYTMSLYTEAPGHANPIRAAMLGEMQAFVRKVQRRADVRRRAYFKPDFSSVASYEKSTLRYRRDLKSLLGWPLTDAHRPPSHPTSSRHVADDDLGSITRMWIETLPGLRTYGIFFRPRGSGPFPFVLSLHGGNGTPELCSGFFGSANYNDMTRRVLRRGIAVFAPQLLLWDSTSYGPDHQKDVIDRRLKQVGSSLAAVELSRISGVLDYFSAHKDIDAARIGVIGLSYGGFYALYAAALDTRIKATVSSCFFSDRRVYDFNDWVWFDAASRFLDAEVGALVCPRSLYVEIGVRDDIFDVKHARPDARRLRAVFRQLGLAKRFRFHEHPGGHELDASEAGIDFLCTHLRNAASSR